MTFADRQALLYLRWLRDAGWLVAAHNDYRQDGLVRSHWSFRRGYQFVYGDGACDCDALLACRNAALKL